MPLFSVSITLVNDSAFKLNAQIVSATGRHLALIHLVPGQMYIYDADQGPFQKNTNQAYTPFTVVFFCESARPYDYQKKEKKKKGEKKSQEKKDSYINQFGIWTNVPTGALVNALGCPTGSKSCIMKKNPNAQGKKQSSGSTNMGSNNWSNDGGQSWQNDAGGQPTTCGDSGSPCTQQPSDDPSSPQFNNYDQESFQNTSGESWENESMKKKKPLREENTTSKKKSLKNPNKGTPLPFIQRD